MEKVPFRLQLDRCLFLGFIFGVGLWRLGGGEWRLVFEYRICGGFSRGMGCVSSWGG